MYLKGVEGDTPKYAVPILETDRYFKGYLFTFIKSSAKIVWKIFIGADYNATYKYVIHHTL
ncbi:hypothetical protein AB2R74_08235 [Staphylococcus aureus]